MEMVKGVGQGQALRQGNFSVELLKHSMSAHTEDQALTFLVTYERFIHAEVLRHRWSSSYSSSRAMPYDKMIAWISKDPAKHLHLGANCGGMQSGERVMNADILESVLENKFYHMRTWCDEIIQKWNIHKEIINRYTEPWGWITGVMTMGHRQFFNFVSLRCSPYANPNIQRLAISMLRLYKSSEPQVLRAREWHTPFYDDHVVWGDRTNFAVQEALVWSSARCAWCSYNAPDKVATYEKAMIRHNDCVTLKHVTPLEHQLQCRRRAGQRGLVPGFNSYRSMIPGESVASVDVDSVLSQYEGKDFLLP